MSDQYQTAPAWLSIIFLMVLLFPQAIIVVVAVKFARKGAKLAVGLVEEYERTTGPR